MTFDCLPKMGKIVIIDDNQEDGLPLLATLSKQGLAAKYFTGDEKKGGVPEVPLNDIRLIFLDICLIADTSNESSIISALDNVFNKIIDKKNIGPYVLIGWTKRTELFKKFLSENLKNCPPIISTCLNKPEYQIPGKNSDPPSYDLIKISKKIDKEFERNEVFKHLILWENLVHDSSNELLKIFNPQNNPDNDEYWNNTVPKIFYNLAKQDMGSSLNDDVNHYYTNVAIHSLLVFNHTFIDTIESNIKKCQEYPKIEMKFTKEKLDLFLQSCGLYGRKLEDFKYSDYFLIVDGMYIPKIDFEKQIEISQYSGTEKEKLQSLFTLDKKISALFNSKLHIFFNNVASPSIDVTPGDIFYLKSDDAIIHSLDEMFKKPFISENKAEFDKMKRIILEISPICDQANKKWKCHRVLPGIICSDVNVVHLKSNTEFIVKSPPIWFNESVCYFVFNIQNLQSLKLGYFDTHEKLGRIRSNLLFNVQSDVAKHMNRVGIIALE